MPRSTQVQRLRVQLAASQDEVRLLKQQVTDLCTENAVAAQKLAVAEQCIAATNARCQDAEQRAEAAELQLLQHVEADQRAGSIKDEENELDKLIFISPIVIEVVQRTGLMAAEEAAWAELIAARASSRDAIRRRRKTLRKRKQQWKRKHRGDAADPAHLEESSGSGADIIAAVHCVANTDSASSAVSTARVPSCKALFVDNVCFWIAAFVPYAWAPVNSEAARTVLKVLNIYKQGWKSIRHRLANFQSMGHHYVLDRDNIGPGVGMIYSRYLAMLTLRHDVFSLRMADRSSMPGEFATRWTLHMDKQLNMYEALRLSQKELYVATSNVLTVNSHARKNIQEALEVYKQRKQTANKDDEAVVPEVDSAA